jgi:hypothetical protein
VPSITFLSKLLFFCIQCVPTSDLQHSLERLSMNQSSLSCLVLSSLTRDVNSRPLHVTSNCRVVNSIPGQQQQQPQTPIILHRVALNHRPTMDTTKGRFTVFPRLPPELRNRIWAFAANNEPRTLDIASTLLQLPPPHHAPRHVLHQLPPHKPSNNQLLISFPPVD